MYIYVSVCVCVCDREREREVGKEGGREVGRDTLITYVYKGFIYYNVYDARLHISVLYTLLCMSILLRSFMIHSWHMLYRQIAFALLKYNVIILYIPRFPR